MYRKQFHDWIMSSGRNFAAASSSSNSPVNRSGGPPRAEWSYALNLMKHTVAMLSLSLPPEMVRDSIIEERSILEDRKQQYSLLAQGKLTPLAPSVSKTRSIGCQASPSVSSVATGSDSPPDRLLLTPDYFLDQGKQAAQATEEVPSSRPEEVPSSRPEEEDHVPIPLTSPEEESHVPIPLTSPEEEGHVPLTPKRNSRGRGVLTRRSGLRSSQGTPPQRNPHRSRSRVR